MRAGENKLHIYKNMKLDTRYLSSTPKNGIGPHTIIIKYNRREVHSCKTKSYLMKTSKDFVVSM